MTAPSSDASPRPCRGRPTGESVEVAFVDQGYGAGRPAAAGGADQDAACTGGTQGDDHDDRPQRRAGIAHLMRLGRDRDDLDQDQRLHAPALTKGKTRHKRADAAVIRTV
jgi:hypothetical protein